jgi:uncharacterized protein (DUF924 family)
MVVAGEEHLMNANSNSAAQDEILDYWFGGIENGFPLEDRSALWFQLSEANDREIEDLFGELLLSAANGELDDWAQTPRGSLALIVLLDQFPRHIYRGSARAFEFDYKAVEVAKDGVELGHHHQLAFVEQGFYFMPFEHSEKFADQQFGVGLFNTLLEEVPEEHKEKVADSLRWAQQHRDLIKRFGRFPHRNKVLERESTEEEQEYLQKGGATFGQ